MVGSPTNQLDSRGNTICIGDVLVYGYNYGLILYVAIGETPKMIRVTRLVNTQHWPNEIISGHKTLTVGSILDAQATLLSAALKAIQ
jgi:hypothetical protein